MKKLKFYPLILLSAAAWTVCKKCCYFINARTKFRYNVNCFGSSLETIHSIWCKARDKHDALVFDVVQKQIFVLSTLNKYTNTLYNYRQIVNDDMRFQSVLDEAEEVRIVKQEYPLCLMECLSQMTFHKGL